MALHVNIPTNCHLYHYAGNNPVRYTDPEGRFVSSDDETQNSTILSDINRIAGNGFYFDNNNNLQIDKSAVPGENYSKEIRNELISLIEGKNKDIQVYIKYSYTYTDMLPDDTEGKFNEVQGCPNLGKTAYGDPLGKTFRVAVPSNLGVNNNGERASIFVHEFIGHLVPTLYGKSGGNAVRDTMPIIKNLCISIPEFLQLPWSEPVCEYHDGALDSVNKQGWIKK